MEKLSALDAAVWRQCVQDFNLTIRPSDLLPPTGGVERGYTFDQAGFNASAGFFDRSYNNVSAVQVKAQFSFS